MSDRRPEYAVPFADLLRPLTPAEYDALRESVKDHGNRIVTPVVVYQSKKHGPAIIDGQHRWKVAGELGIDCPVTDMGELTDTEAKALARQLNVARRHLKFDDWRQANDIDKQARVKRVAEKRKEGKSIRTIAEEEGVSKSQVERDIEEIQSNETSTVPIGTVEPKPEQPAVVGKNGKTYRQPPKAPPSQPAASEPVSEQEQLPVGDPVQPVIIPPKVKPVPQVDAWGIEIQEHAVEAFEAVPKFLELLTLLKRVRGELTALCEMGGGVHLQKRCQWVRSQNAAGGRWVLAELDNAIGAIEDATPKHTDCPYHFNPHMPHADGEAPVCPLCLDRRFTGDLRRRQVPPEAAKAMREHYGVTEGD